MVRAESNKHPLRNAAFLIVFTFLAVSLFFALLELASMILNGSSEAGRQPYLVDAHRWRDYSRGILQVGGTTKMSFVDPHLGYAHDPAADSKLSKDGSIPGFVLFGDPGFPDAVRIVALGGSTTDPLDKGNWPRALSDILSADGIPSVVYNGGVSGYSSNQEMLKLIRDVLPLSPDVVISLNGVNDLGFVHSVKVHPMVHPYQQRLLTSVTEPPLPVILPNFMRALRRAREGSIPANYRVTGINYGTEVRSTPADQWSRNIQIMQAVARQFEFPYLCFLQPTLGIGKYSPTSADEELLETAKRSRRNYLEHVNDFYESAIPLAEEHPFVVNLTDLFADETGIYRDVRHPNADGYRIIAAAIYDELRRRGILSQAKIMKKQTERHLLLMARIATKFETSSPDQPEGEDARTSLGTLQVSERLGYSQPRTRDGKILHFGGGNLYVAGWYISTQKSTVSVLINGEAVELRYHIRRDLESKFADYAFRPGWVVEVPAEKLLTANVMQILLNGEIRQTVRIERMDYPESP